MHLSPEEAYRYQVALPLEQVFSELTRPCDQSMSFWNTGLLRSRCHVDAVPDRLITGLTGSIQRVSSAYPRPLPVLPWPAAGSTESRATIPPRHLHQGVAVGLECCAVGDCEALAAALLSAQLPHQRCYHGLVALVQGRIHFVQQEQRRP